MVFYTIDPQKSPAGSLLCLSLTNSRPITRPLPRASPQTSYFSTMLLEPPEHVRADRLRQFSSRFSSSMMSRTASAAGAGDRVAAAGGGHLADALEHAALEHRRRGRDAAADALAQAQHVRRQVSRARCSTSCRCGRSDAWTSSTMKSMSFSAAPLLHARSASRRAGR